MPDSTRSLLRYGSIAGPLYLAVGYAQAFTREGFDLMRHPLSQLANGDLGWIQTANFVVTGLLSIAGAVGVRRALRGQRAGTWGPILFGVFGLGLLAAAAFPADPGNGFPPGTPETGTMTSRGMMHFVAGALTFYALIAACFVFTRRFAGLGRSGWAALSLITGVAFLACFSAIPMGLSSPLLMPGLYVVVTGALLWHSAVHRDIARSAG